MEILRARGAPEAIIRAVGAHANHTGIPRESLLERAIFACDEISGFVIAVALVKGRALSAVTPESVRKRMKEKSFARGVNRDDLLQGAEELGIPFDEHVEHVVRALQGIADHLGLSP